MENDEKDISKNFNDSSEIFDNQEGSFEDAIAYQSSDSEFGALADDVLNEISEEAIEYTPDKIAKEPVEEIAKEEFEEVSAKIDDEVIEEKTLEDKLKEQDEFSFLDEETTKDSIETAPLVANEDVEEETIKDLITVRPVKFQQFEQTVANRSIKKNLDIMQDISMHISVELGRTKSSIREVMEMEEGSVVELDKIAGEQVEVFVNDKLVAKGEVIVIEDRFGVRVTSTNIQKAIQ